jgi:hypothetical protein
MATGTQPQTVWASWTLDTGDTLGWGKAQGRAETSALWTPSSWKASPHPDILKEQLALHTKPCPIRLQSRYSAGLGISDPWACCSTLPGPCAHKLPPLRTAQSLPNGAPKAYKAGDPQAFTISARWASAPKAYTDLHELRPARPCS